MRSSLLKKLLLDGRVFLSSQIPIPPSKAVCGRVELCQEPVPPEHPIFHASPLVWSSDGVAVALQQVHKCYGGLWGGNKAENGGVKAKGGFQLWEQIALCADPSLLLPRGSACP